MNAPAFGYVIGAYSCSLNHVR